MREKEGMRGNERQRGKWRISRKRQMRGREMKEIRENRGQEGEREMREKRAKVFNKVFIY